MESIILALSKFLDSFAALTSAAAGLIAVAIAYWKMRTKRQRSRRSQMGESGHDAR